MPITVSSQNGINSPHSRLSTDRYKVYLKYHGIYGIPGNVNRKTSKKTSRRNGMLQCVTPAMSAQRKKTMAYILSLPPTDEDMTMPSADYGAITEWHLFFTEQKEPEPEPEPTWKPVTTQRSQTEDPRHETACIQAPVPLFECPRCLKRVIHVGDPAVVNGATLARGLGLLTYCDRCSPRGTWI